MKSGNFQELFHEYDKREFRLVALRGKRPFVKDWQKKSNAFVYDKLHEELGLNLGIQTGSNSKLLVLDFDDAEQASKFYRELRGEKLTTAAVQTGGDRGSVHFYFTVLPGARVPGRNLICQLRQVKVGELKGDGGLVVAPPSFHPDTRRAYEWIEPLERLRSWQPEIGVIAGLEPEQTKPRQQELKLRGLADKRGVECVASIREKVLAEGVRNESLWVYYCLLRQNGDTPSYAAAQVRELNSKAINKQGKPEPLPEDEIKSICSERGKGYRVSCQKLREQFGFDFLKTCAVCRFRINKEKRTMSAIETARLLEGNAFNLSSKLYLGVKLGEYDISNKSELARMLGVSREGIRQAIEKLEGDGVKLD